MNQVMDIWNMNHVEGGDERKIRGEYVELDEEGHKVKGVKDDAIEAEPERVSEPGADVAGDGPEETEQ